MDQLPRGSGDNEFGISYRSYLNSGVCQRRGAPNQAGNRGFGAPPAWVDGGLALGGRI